MNKVTGGLLFVFPQTLTFIDLRYSAAVICAVATIAAVNEGYLILAGTFNQELERKRTIDEGNTNGKASSAGI